MCFAIKGPPKIRRPYTQYAREGHSARVECAIEATPTPQRIQWSKSGRIVGVDNDIGVEIIEEVLESEQIIKSVILIRNSRLVSLSPHVSRVLLFLLFIFRVISVPITVPFGTSLASNHVTSL